MLSCVCRSMAGKLLRVTEKLANLNLERKGGDKNSEIVFQKHFMTNQRYKEMRNSHQDCHTEVPDLSDLLKYFIPVEVEPSFWEFVQYVLAHPTGDPHWKPFTQVCGNDQGKLTSSSQMICACLVFLSSKNFTSLIYKLDSFGF